MNNKGTAAHLREWVKTVHMPFDWPTDACGYEQHIKFVMHRNKNWTGPGLHYSNDKYNDFVLAYADMLDGELDE